MNHGTGATMIGSLVSAGISKVALMWLNSEFGRYGMMQKLEIDNTTKTIRASVMLKGENEPIEISCGYSIEQSKLHLQDIKTSREWMTMLATEYLAKKEIALPPAVAKTVGLLL